MEFPEPVIRVAIEPKTKAQSVTIYGLSIDTVEVELEFVITPPPNTIMQRCAESRALRHAQRRCRGEGVAQYALHHRAGGRERCADEYRRQNARQADVHNGGLIFLFALAGERTENVRQADFQRADAHIHHGGKKRNKRRSRKRYALAGDELFILFDFYWVLLQLYHTFVIRE